MKCAVHWRCSNRALQTPGTRHREEAEIAKSNHISLIFDWQIAHSGLPLRLTYDIAGKNKALEVRK